MHISIFGVNEPLEKIRCADQVSMSWILLGLLLEEREAFDFSDSLWRSGAMVSKSTKRW
jgi:hypothetical protein